MFQYYISWYSDIPPFGGKPQHWAKTRVYRTQTPMSRAREGWQWVRTAIIECVYIYNHPSHLVDQWYLYIYRYTVYYIFVSVSNIYRIVSIVIYSVYINDTSSERPVQTVEHAGLEFINQGCLSLSNSCWGSINKTRAGGIIYIHNIYIYTYIYIYIDIYIYI